MYIEPLTVLKHRIEDLVLELADRYGLPYNVVRARCRGFIDSLFECWVHSLDWDRECRVERELLEECVERLDSMGGGGIRVFEVLGEDPWRARLVEEVRAASCGEALDKLGDVISRYVAEGYECFDHGSASNQLCIKRRGNRLSKLLITAWCGESLGGE